MKTSAIGKARLTVDGGKSRGSSAAATMDRVAELAAPGASSGPLTRKAVRLMATKLSISVLTTSSTPSRALRTSGTAIHSAPTAAAVTIAAPMMRTPDRPARP